MLAQQQRTLLAHDVAVLLLFPPPTDDAFSAWLDTARPTHLTPIEKIQSFHNFSKTAW